MLPYMFLVRRVRSMGLHHDVSICKCRASKCFSCGHCTKYKSPEDCGAKDEHSRSKKCVQSRDPTSCRVSARRDLGPTFVVEGSQEMENVDNHIAKETCKHEETTSFHLLARNDSSANFDVSFFLGDIEIDSKRKSRIKATTFIELDSNSHFGAECIKLCVDALDTFIDIMYLCDIDDDQQQSTDDVKNDRP